MFTLITGKEKTKESGNKNTNIKTILYNIFLRRKKTHQCLQKYQNHSQNLGLRTRSAVPRKRIVVIFIQYIFDIYCNDLYFGMV